MTGNNCTPEVLNRISSGVKQIGVLADLVPVTLGNTTGLSLFIFVRIPLNSSKIPYRSAAGRMDLVINSAALHF